MLRKYSFRTALDIFAPNPGFELAFAVHINLSTLLAIAITTIATPTQPSSHTKAAILPKSLVF
ncbi:hypothetical protein HUN01_25250 [Nostoc edaphicum CCNP1411]|uniref:Uncharacterized protein n=1 Tax=Nostoc edaphicum CCNP1411 TaxID=1472755 RepID=A0A7D7LH96_9NOSO|nr:hypothetical protein [Nostoc edaphicum]QMS90731.1 hypothetical protein HUN01_25250 [Nostoc edaphicum CCNP1411]